MFSWQALNHRKRKKRKETAQAERKPWARHKARMKKHARRKRREVRKALVGA
jgi:hypothetical protein